MSTSRVGGARVWVSRLAPYLIAALALAYVFRTTDLVALKAALAHAPILLFVVISAVILVANCAADTFAMHRVFGWFGCHVPYRDLFIIRASTYLLAVVNYHVGQAAIVGYLSRARRIPLLRATGWILFIIGVNVGTLFLLASAGAWAAVGTEAFRAALRDLFMAPLMLLSSGGANMSGALALIPIATIVGAIAWAVLLSVRPRILAERRVLAPLFQMGVSGHIKGVLVRLPHVAVLCLWHFVSLRLFGVEVPLLVALMYLPIYFAAASLPLNVNGLGVAQLVAIQFFSKYGGGTLSDGRAAVIAYSLSTAMVSLFLQLGLGLLCIRKATLLGMPREAPEEFEAEAAAAVIADTPSPTKGAATLEV